MDVPVALGEIEMLAFTVFPMEIKKGWTSGQQQSAGRTGNRLNIQGYAASIS